MQKKCDISVRVIQLVFINVIPDKIPFGLNSISSQIPFLI
jgi:hypothetical protein